MRKLKLRSTAEFVMYAVTNEIVHVTLAPVLSFPEMWGGGRTLRRTLNGLPRFYAAGSHPRECGLAPVER